MDEQTGNTTHVLVFCENEERSELFASLFKISGLKTGKASHASEFLEKLGQGHVDVVLLLTETPEHQAFELCNEIKQPGSPYRNIPAVFVFREGTPVEVALQGLHLGAYDYLIEPFNEIELLTKITVLARVKHAEDEFRKLAIQDPLTGLYDRRYLFIRFEEELSRAKRYSKPISCITLDIDGFMTANQQYGSDAGDVLLQCVADKLRHVKREIDVLARQENDKFIFVLYNTDATGAMVLARRLLSQLHEVVCPFDRDYEVAASLGLAHIETSPDQVFHAEELQQRAELALAKAKRDGGDRVVLYSDQLAGDLMLH